MPARKSSPIAAALLAAADRLADAVDRLSFGSPAAFVYNPLRYARKPYALYVRRFGAETKRTVFLGMNPGPFGMAQTGVPFGEIRAVRDWMGLIAAVGRPLREHPKRPVLGFDCTRSEVSGKRLWGLAESRFGAADVFFARHFVVNYCPLLFTDEGGRNVTPDKLAVAERKALEAACDKHLAEILESLDPEFLVGIGTYARDKLTEAAGGLSDKKSRRVVLLPHPSPANPAANKGWNALATVALEAAGVWTPSSAS